MRTKEELIEVVNKYEQEILVEPGVLHFEYNADFDTSNLENFLLQVVRWNKGYDDKKLGNTYTANEDYQCRTNANRSIGDLFLLARNYYSNTITLLEVMQAMYNLVEGDAKFAPGIYVISFICPDINKYVIYTEYRNISNPSDSENKYTTYKHTKNSYTNKNEFDIQAEDYVTLFKESTPAEA